MFGFVLIRSRFLPSPKYSGNSTIEKYSSDVADESSTKTLYLDRFCFDFILSGNPINYSISYKYLIDENPLILLMSIMKSTISLVLSMCEMVIIKSNCVFR